VCVGGPSRGSEARSGAIGRWCLCAETIVSMWLIGWMAGICARSVRGLFRRGASDLRPGLGYAAPSELGCGWGDGDLSGSFPGLANAARPGAPGVSAVAVGNFAGGMAADLFLALDVDCRNPYTKRSLEGMRTGWLLPRSRKCSETWGTPRGAWSGFDVGPRTSSGAQICRSFGAGLVGWLRFVCVGVWRPRFSRTCHAPASRSSD